jgi:dolichol-phosphate mannosyltransferase
VKVAVIIPSYRVLSHIKGVIKAIGPEVSAIYVVDDCCPESTGKAVKEANLDPRVKVLFNDKNLGVGGAVITGYKQALKDGCDVMVKLDGDAQMDPGLIPLFIEPIIAGVADYTKGNRFYDIEKVRQMPAIRLFGNSGLSFINKIVSGYWSIMDPTNGFTAIHKTALSLIPVDKLSQRYFFESDMLFRLGTTRAVVIDIPMEAKYADEKSNLSIQRVLFEFPPLYLSRFIKRIIYGYILRDFNLASIEFFLGFILLWFGVIFGATAWHASSVTNVAATTGTVMVASLPIIVGIQLLLSAIGFDLSNQPTIPLSVKHCGRDFSKN